MVSIVLFQRRLRCLESRALAALVEEAWGGDYGDGEDEGADGFVVGASPVFMLKSPHGMFMIHNAPDPYFDEIGEARRSAASRSAAAEGDAGKAP